MSKRMVQVIALFFVAVTGLIAQTANQKSLIQRKIEFEVIRSDNAHVLAREGCFGLKFVSVYVLPTSAAKEKIEQFAREIARTFPAEYDLVVEFTVDRYSPTDSIFDEENRWLQNLRGLYIRSKSRNIEKIFTFPNGTNRDEFEKLVETQEN